MKIIRKSYVPDLDSKDNLIWQIMTVVSFLIILILFVLLVFGYLDSLNNTLNMSAIDKLTSEKNKAYTDAENSLKDIEEKLLATNKNYDEIMAKNGEKIDFYSDMKKIQGVQISVSQKLNSSLDTKGILKSNPDKIFVSKNGNLIIANSFLFSDADSSVLNDYGKECAKLLANALNEIFKSRENQKYIKYISIDSFTQKEKMDEAGKMLANQRALNFLNEILSSNAELKKNYSQKLICSNRFDTVSVADEDNKDVDSRIEFSVTYDIAAINAGIQKFIE